ncbi:MAG: hypothetical protein LIP03_01890, partial [Bacteroidales bacterium]|nr:hypothetical protein [Bacteroidales bacterium]
LRRDLWLSLSHGLLRMSLYFSGTYEDRTLTGEETELWFNPDIENNMTVYRYDGTYYELALNDNVLANAFSSYTVQGVQDGDVVKVTVAYPELPTTLTIVVPEGCESFISRVVVNGEDVTYEPTMTLNYGDVVAIYLNSTDYTYSSYPLINGESTYWYSGKSLTLAGDTVMEFLDVKLKEKYIVNIVVDNPEAITFYKGYADSGVTVDLGDGTAQIEATDQSYWQINTNDGYAFNTLTVTTEDGTVRELSHNLTYTYFNYYYSSYGNNCTLNITTGGIEELRTATATVNIDDADGVTLYIWPTGLRDLVSGENIIKFVPGTEDSFNFTYSKGNFYSVYLNGENQNVTSSSAYIYVTNGDVIDITTQAPVGNATVKIEFADELSRECVTDLMLDGETLEGWDSLESFEVALGTKLSIEVNKYAYNIKQFLVNGVNVIDDFYYYYTTNVTEDLDIYIEAAYYGTAHVLMTVDGSDRVKVTYTDEASDERTLVLQEGLNEIDVIENHPTIVIQAASTLYEIISITDVDGNDVVDDEWRGYYYVNAYDGLNMNIVTKEIVYDTNAMAYVGAGSYYSVTLHDAAYDVSFSLASYGENAATYIPLGFNADEVYDGTFILYAQTPGTTYGYLNNVALENEDAKYFTASGLEITNGSVVKVFVEEPFMTVVTVEDESNCVEEVITDRIVSQYNTSEFECLEGTEVEIRANEAKVTVNDVEIEGADGVFTFTVDTESPKVVVTATSGIESVAADRLVNGNVYNVQGMLLIKAATADQIKALPAGIYVINGEKVRIR